MDFLLLRFDAPLMSFGGPVVDNRGPTETFPGLAMISGLLANALGYDHRDHEKLDALQARIRYASRCDRPGTRLRDYQTVDLGQDFLVDTGWTTQGVREDRGKGKATKGTHIRLRDYWADAIHTLAITLDSADEMPDLETIEMALRHPERPLFIGRKCCLPAGPILFGRTQATSLRDALAGAPRVKERGVAGPLSAIWPESEGDEDGLFRRLGVTDERDWRNQIHVGRRIIVQGHIEPPAATTATPGARHEA